MRSKSSAVSASCRAVRFSLDKEHFRRIQVEPGVTVCHLYPTLAAWIGRAIRDDVNPRSHDDNALKGGVPRAIHDTINDAPEDFYLANRGITILGESISYDPDKQVAEIALPNSEGDLAVHGVADGGTTDAVIAQTQKVAAQDLKVTRFLDLTPDQIPPNFLAARVHLEVIVGLENRDRIIRLVQGRNTSRQVKTWTISDFKGNFDWIRDLLEDKSSPFKGRVGYEENEGKEVNILEVIAIMTLFHPEYDGKGKAPTVAYSSKGRMDAKLVDTHMEPGYKAMEPVLLDILKLHDHVYATFHERYCQGRPNGRLGRWGRTEERIFPKRERKLPLSGRTAAYSIPSGALYPLLASLRALLEFPKNNEGNAKWKMDPFKFFDRNGAELVDNLFSQLEAFQNNPQTLGKTKIVYTALHDRVHILSERDSGN